MVPLTRRDWRVYDTGERTGAFNMALDLVMLDQVIAAPEGTPPSLRAYAWEPACVSLGYHQRIRTEDLERYARHGCDVVRRPTGGRAVLHWREITYSLVVPETVFPEQLSVIESYRVLSQGLIAAFAELGVCAELGTQSAPTGHSGSPACFASAARCDLVCGGKKIVGSAQVRRRGAILQHGSIPLEPRQLLERDVLLGADSQPVDGVVSLSEAAGRVVTYEEAARALMVGFSRTFGLPTSLSPLPPETAEAASLRLAETQARAYEAPATA